MKIIWFFFIVVPVVDGLSLNQLICQRQPRLCQDEAFVKNEKNSPLTERTIPLTSANQNPFLTKTFLREADPTVPRRPTDFSSWSQYGKSADDGTGYGSGIGPGYGPGLGDVAVRTGVGVQHPFGSLGVRRDFEIGLGGSGRIGGVPFGYGNGYSANGLGMSQSGWPHSPPFTNGDIWPLG
ncbi:hypothetical protein FO519_005742 [Halicephalobus sp. NKZ332]|nr:hypothetical protein FO519_005742 [Halicephalobus sp. NKZ332]